MTEKLQLYKCETCGNLVEVLADGIGELVCCGKAMELLDAQTDETVRGESHLPYIFKNEEGKTIIQVGKTLHPMLPEHYIQFIQVISDDKKMVLTKLLEPEEPPKMELEKAFENFCAREHCNIHGLWER